MGNTHIFYHRVPALSTALLASIAYSFVLVAGSTCDFISVYAEPGSFLEYTTEDGIVVDKSEANLGLMCETPPLFTRANDQLWSMSLYFWIASSVTGALAVSLSWALAVFLGPTDMNWKILSFLSGVSAILQSPMYLMFLSEPCKSNICLMDTGCIMLTISTLFWITMTILTQCQEPPTWANELNAWRVQKDRQNGVARPPMESRWSRWIKRKKWATTLGLSPTDSDSINEVSRMELLENGSYYADSNNSRLMLKVIPKRPDDESVATFGDLEDMMKYADEEREKSPLENMRIAAHQDVNNPASLLGVESDTEEPREFLTIHSHMDADDTIEEKLEETPLLLTDGESPSKSCMHPPRQIRITGIRSLASRLHRESKRPRTGYAHLDSDGNSDADIEDEVDDCREEFYSPMSPGQLNRLNQDESPIPLCVEGSENHDLLHDWNTLHAAAYLGIMLPATVPITGDEDEAEPKFYGSDDTASEISLSSSAEFPDDEQLNGGMSGASSVSSDSSNDERPRRFRGGKRIHRRAFSATNSVGSRTSLLDLTIEEETPGDLQEMGSSEDDRMVETGLSQGYALRGVKSAPDRLSFSATLMAANNADNLNSRSMPRGELDCVSEDSGSNISEILRNADEVTRDGPATDISEESTALSSGQDTEKESGSTSLADAVPKRGRCISVPRRKRATVHPVLPLPRPKSETTSFREESIEKAGIHSPHINVVSDDSSASDESYSGKSFRSTVSRRARKARVRRMHEATARRRARTVGPSKRRLAPPKPEVVIFDPTLRAILVNRDPGKEYGPDEASL